MHSLEHGAVWVTYDVAGERRRAGHPDPHCRRATRSSRRTRACRARSAVRVEAQLSSASASDPRISEFFEEYWRSQNVPEPGAACTGAIDGPGKTS